MARQGTSLLAGRLAQLVEHRLYTPAVTGSSPVPPTQNCGLRIADVQNQCVIPQSAIAICNPQFAIRNWESSGS